MLQSRCKSQGNIFVHTFFMSLQSALMNFSQKLLSFNPFRMFIMLSTTFLILSMSAHAHTNDHVLYTEKLSQTLSDQSIKTAGKFNVEGQWTPEGFNPKQINDSTVVAFDIGSWQVEKTMGEATSFNPQSQKALFSFQSYDSAGKKVQWLKISLNWNQLSISFNVVGQTTEFLPSPLAGDFLADEPGRIVASTVGSFRIGELYGSFELPLKGKVTAVEKQTSNGTIYILKSDNISSKGSWATWVDNNLSLSSTAMSGKGICIEDRSAALPPSGNYPIIATDTFPSLWPETGFLIDNIRVFSYSLGTAPAKEWVLWAIQHNIKVLVGINLQDYKTDLANLSADYLAADPYLRSCFDRNILAYAIGNEANIPEIPSIRKGIEATRKLIKAGKLPAKPVSSVLNLNEQWIVNTFPPQNAEFTKEFKTLLPSLDILMFNTYGGYFIYEPSLLQASLSWTSNGEVFSILLNQFGSIRSAQQKANVLKKPLWICETGWSSAPLSNHPEPAGWSSFGHLKTFYRNFLTFDQNIPYYPQLATEQVTPPEMIFYFGLRDSFLPLLNVEEYFGLYKSAPYLIQKDL